MNRKFRLIAKAANKIVYQAVYTLSENQYKEILDYYTEKGWADVNIDILKKYVGKKFDSDKSYVEYANTHPDAVVAMVIRERFTLFQTWDFEPFGDVEARTKIEKNKTQQFSWHCQRLSK
jgi:hypothetical protein